ncbi:GfV-B23-ORF1 [Ichnoviriform fumiferanae]|uniref:GfV-B23-ORF1 n=1 Tax=Ichnoviriform fumiferanae TaxID=419435 RepID=A2PZS2_9VIRU|nr:GfV-B23-ORF1 [Ichnoviriform fumiferanae]BAF45494.1 GfV-B23-ORF1 [Ichnoviriform fumiferanae]
MLNNKQKKQAINGGKLLHVRNNPDKILEYIILFILRHARKHVFKIFEDIHCGNEKTFLIRFPTYMKNVCNKDHAKLRTLWFWQIHNLILAINVLLIYINNEYHMYHKK